MNGRPRLGTKENSVSDCDVLVIGGGPAGTSAAIRIALGGLRVVLIERSIFPRHRPGESLHPGIEPLLMQLGVWERVERAGFIRHSGIQFQHKGRVAFNAFGSDANGPWLGFQAWRADFDQMLLERALELGVKVWQPCAVQKVVCQEGRVVGVECDRGSIRAYFTIDSTGNSQWLAHQLSLPIEKASPRLIARYGYVEGEFAEGHHAPIFMLSEFGWTWIARVQDQRYQWTRLNLSYATVLDDQQLSSEPPIELQTLKTIGHTCGADVTWRCVASPAGKGYFLCGDAAAVLDPASSHGVLKAVLSGIYASHLILQTRIYGLTTEKAATEYSNWLTRWFQNDVTELRELYSNIGLSDL